MFPTNHHGIATVNKESVLAFLSRDADILLFGDTKHSDTTLKGSVFSMLPALKSMQYGGLCLELDHIYQNSLQQVTEPKPPFHTMDIFEEIAKLSMWASQWANKLRNKTSHIFVDGIFKAQTLGMQVTLIDDKSPAENFRKDNPCFEEMQKRFNQERARTETETAELTKQRLFGAGTEERAYFDAMQAEWKRIRNGLNGTFAERIASSYQNFGKQVAIVGDGHFNAENDLDEALQAKGLRTRTIHVSKDLSALGGYLTNFIDRSPEDGRPRKLPDAIYIVDFGMFADPKNEHLQNAARQCYQAKESKIANYVHPDYRIYQQAAVART